MNRDGFLERLNELMNLPKGTVQGAELLSTLSGWDSVALMGFIAFLDEDFGVRVTGRQVIQSNSVEDLIALAGDKIR
jgi:acyl carrier protein